MKRVLFGVALSALMVGGVVPSVEAAEAAACPAAAKTCAAKKVPRGTQAAALYQRNASPALAPIVSAVADAFKKNVLESPDADARRFGTFLTDSGLLAAGIDWALVPVVDAQKADETAVTVAVRHDRAKVEQALTAYAAAQEGLTVEKKVFDGVPGWRLSCGESAEKVDFTLSVASLKDGLLVGAPSEPALQSLLAVYAKGAATEGAFKSLGSDGTAMVTLSVARFGDLLKSLVPEDALAGVEVMLPNGKAILFGLGRVDFSLQGVGANATVRLSAVTRGVEDATALVTALNMGKGMAAADEDPMTQRLVKGLTIEAKGPVATVVLKLSAEDVAEIANAVKGIFL